MGDQQATTASRHRLHTEESPRTNLPPTPKPLSRTLLVRHNGAVLSIVSCQDRLQPSNSRTNASSISGSPPEFRQCSRRQCSTPPIPPLPVRNRGRRAAEWATPLNASLCSRGLRFFRLSRWFSPIADRRHSSSGKTVVCAQFRCTALDTTHHRGRLRQPVCPSTSASSPPLLSLSAPPGR
jgi:hypothetical protein